MSWCCRFIYDFLINGNWVRINPFGEGFGALNKRGIAPIPPFKILAHEWEEERSWSWKINHFEFKIKTLFDSSFVSESTLISEIPDPLSRHGWQRWKNTVIWMKTFAVWNTCVKLFYLCGKLHVHCTVQARRRLRDTEQFKTTCIRRICKSSWWQRSTDRSRDNLRSPHRSVS